MKTKTNLRRLLLEFTPLALKYRIRSGHLLFQDRDIKVIFDSAGVWAFRDPSAKRSPKKTKT